MKVKGQQIPINSLLNPHNINKGKNLDKFEFMKDNSLACIFVQ
jgi:hypothetical protein